jgi:hypothetical protein
MVANLKASSGIFPEVCGPPFHLYLPVHLQTLCYHPAGSGPVFHMMSTTSTTRPIFLSQNLDSAWKNEDWNAYSYCEDSGIGTEM